MDDNDLKEDEKEKRIVWGLRAGYDENWRYIRCVHCWSFHPWKCQFVYFEEQDRL